MSGHGFTRSPIRAAIALVFGAGAADLPPDFAADRGLLYFGHEFNLAALAGDVPATLAQLRAQLGWLEDCLADGRDFLTGARPGLTDALGYYLVWFIRGRYAKGPEFLQPFVRLCAWERRVKALGHGNSIAMGSGEALNVAREAQSKTPEYMDPNDPLVLTLDDGVEVTPEGVGGAPSVSGRVHVLAPNEIVILRTDARVGEVAVHFPRVGYRVHRA